MSDDLYSRFFARTIFPVLDRLNGTRIARILDGLRDLEYLPRHQIRANQEEKLSRTLRLVRNASGFYRRHHAEAPRGPASEWPELDGLPLVTKADLRARPAEVLPDARGRVLATRTSGSTGAPMVFHRSATQESWFWALRFRIWSWAGYQPGDRYVEINLNAREAWKKRLQDLLFRCAYLTGNTDTQENERIAAALRQRGGPFLNGFSSSLYVLARYLEERGETIPLVGVAPTGDTLFQPWRDAIEKAFQVRALDYYGAGGEGFHIASQCPQSGSRFHVHPENTILEILDETGPVAPGQRGRIVATQLDNEAMPLVRYDLGDVATAAAADASCSCGRTLPMIESVEGRIPDLVVTASGGVLVPHFFVVVMKNLEGVARYQVIQEERHEILLRLVPGPGADRPDVEQAIRREVRRATKDTLATRFDWVDEIPLSGAGKRRLVISRLGDTAIGSNDRIHASGASDPHLPAAGGASA